MDYDLTLRPRAGLTTTILVSKAFYEPLGVGDTVTAKWWRGKIRVLTHAGTDFNTYDSPASQMRHSLHFIFIGAMLSLYWVAGVLLIYARMRMAHSSL